MKIVGTDGTVYWRTPSGKVVLAGSIAAQMLEAQEAAGRIFETIYEGQAPAQMPAQRGWSLKWVAVVALGIFLLGKVK